ncbi:MAG: cytidylate kinase family protein, partial [Lachnospiraceae bacterium]|nr:cytidylate kinase family protein [Lachnospiraceae bacterium]
MRLAKALGIPCYDRQLISMASDRSMIDESLFVEVDEKLRGQSIQKFLNRMPSQAVLEPHEKG